MKNDPNLEAVIEWDVENWKYALTFWEEWLGETSSNSNPKVLTLGERNGGLALWLATRGYPVICSDRLGPTDLARKKHAAFGVEQLVAYENVDIFAIPYPDNFFDLIACKSVLGGLKRDYRDRSTRTIESHVAAVREIRRVLKVGGMFMGAENTKGSFLHSLVRMTLKKNRGWHYYSLEELETLLTDFSWKVIRPYGVIGTFYSHEYVNYATARLDRLLSTILPEKTRYIGFFCAKK